MTVLGDGPRIEPWMASEAQCLTCAHEWVAVHPMGCAALECPKCFSTDTVRGLDDIPGDTPPRPQ